MPPIISLPLPTLRRLPRYLRLFRESASRGEEWLSSEAMSRCLGLTAIQVRKDLGLTGAPASPRMGFKVGETASLIEELLGVDRLIDLILIGSGPRAEAACGDPSLGRRGFRIAAVFDPEPRHESLCGFKILPLSELPSIVSRLRARIALLAIGESRYPGCAHLAAEAGILGLVNISGDPIEDGELPDDLVIIHEDLGFQLTSLAREIDKRFTNK